MKYDPFLLAAAAPVVNRASEPASWVGSAGTNPLQPTEDTFYTFDRANISKYALGDILNSREIGIPKYKYSKAWQILYRSENTFGDATATVTTIVLPEGFDASKGATNVVSYQQAEDSSFLNCNPSYGMLIGDQNGELQAILDQGYILNYPDHEGINSSFTAGPLEGKLTLDSVRALKKSSEFTGVTPGSTIFWGYSGGSIATGWAAELYDWYAPELEVAAMIVGGFVANLTATVELVNGTPLVGFVPPGIWGLVAEYPELAAMVDTELKPEYADKAKDAVSQCVMNDILEFFNMNIFDFFNSGSQVFEIPAIKNVLQNTTLGSHAPTIPLLVYQGIEDQIAPVKAADDTVSSYCRNGGKVRYVRESHQDHVGAAANYDGTVMSSFADIFAGNVWDKCEVIGLPIGDYTNNTVPQPKNLGGSATTSIPVTAASTSAPASLTVTSASSPAQSCITIASADNVEDPILSSVQAVQGPLSTLDSLVKNWKDSDGLMGALGIQQSYYPLYSAVLSLQSAVSARPQIASNNVVVYVDSLNTLVGDISALMSSLNEKANSFASVGASQIVVGDIKSLAGPASAIEASLFAGFPSDIPCVQRAAAASIASQFASVFNGAAETFSISSGIPAFPTAPTGCLSYCGAAASSAAPESSAPAASSAAESSAPAASSVVAESSAPAASSAAAESSAPAASSAAAASSAPAVSSAAESSAPAASCIVSAPAEAKDRPIIDSVEAVKAPLSTLASLVDAWDSAKGLLGALNVQRSYAPLYTSVLQLQSAVSVVPTVEANEISLYVTSLGSLVADIQGLMANLNAKAADFKKVGAAAIVSLDIKSLAGPASAIEW